MICSPTTIKKSHRKVGLLTLVPFARCKKVLGLKEFIFSSGNPGKWSPFLLMSCFWMGFNPQKNWRSVDRHFRPWFQGPGLAECFGRATTWRFPVPWGKGAISGGGLEDGEIIWGVFRDFWCQTPGNYLGLKQPFINGCFNWMIPNLYIENCCFTNHAFINGCLGFQVYITSPTTLGSSENHWTFLKSDSTLVGGTFVGWETQEKLKGVENNLITGSNSKFWSKKYWYTLW